MIFLSAIWLPYSHLLLPDINFSQLIFELKGHWESRSKVGSLNSDDHPVEFEPRNVSYVGCVVCIMHYLVTSSRSFKLSLWLENSFITEFLHLCLLYCSIHYHLSRPLLILSSRTISTHVSLSFSQISAISKSICHLLPSCPVWLFHYKRNPSFK